MTFFGNTVPMGLSARIRCVMSGGLLFGGAAAVLQTGWGWGTGSQHQEPDYFVHPPSANDLVDEREIPERFFR